jgi:Ca-activated chloride channel family protein
MPRYSCNLLALLVAFGGVCVSAQNTQDLPSAPSATLAKPQPAPDPPPQPEPKQQEGKKDAGAPVLESLEPHKPAPPSVQQTAAPAPAQKPGDSKPANSDQQGSDNQAPSTVIRTSVNEVNVVFTVTDKHNHYVKDLKQTDFRILDNKRPPENVRRFASETNLPLRVGLLVDVSNSIRDRFRFEQQAAIEFLSQIIRPKRDEAFTLGFDTTPEVTQDFTGDTEKLSNGIRMLRPGGGTALYDALYGACREKLMNDKFGGMRRAIILLSDGEDNQSRVTRDDAIEEAQRAEVIVYAISTNVSGNKSRGDKIMETIAAQTGGRAFFPFKIEDVSDAFSQIQEELRSQYAISYIPSDFTADGKYRSIDIEPVDKKYRVRSRKGYFAPKPEPTRAAGGK